MVHFLYTGFMEKLNRQVFVKETGNIKMKTVTEKYQNLPIVSAALAIINVLVYMICAVTGDNLYLRGELTVFDVAVKGEYGRIIWAMFLHGDLDHIFNNVLILFFMGAMIEKEVGHLRYAVCYFLSGIGGNILSLVFKLMVNDWSGSIGASGAIFGMNGMLLAMVLFCDRRMPTVTPARVVLMIILSLYSGFSGEQIDNAAHIGGLITGFLTATIMCIIQRRKTAHKQTV